MLAGATMETMPQQRSGTSNLVAWLHPCALKLRMRNSDTYRLRLTRSQTFSNEEYRITEVFLDRLSSIMIHSSTDFFADLMNSLPRDVIAHCLTNRPSSIRTIREVLTTLDSLAARTYEGRPIVTAVGITGSINHGAITLNDLWEQEFAPVLSNGFDTLYKCGCDGRIFNLEAVDEPTQNLWQTPYRLSRIANWCHGTTRVALVLNRNGEILVFREKKLLFARRSGKWQSYQHETIVPQIKYGARKLREAVYESCLDASFGRSGACIAILDRDENIAGLNLLAKDDLLARQSCTKTKLVSKAVNGRRFYDLDRRLRHELLSMDGATVLKSDGTIITCGSIVRVRGGSTGGGRKAAAIALSGYGLGIKISADGPVTGYQNKKVVFRF